MPQGWKDWILQIEMKRLLINGSGDFTHQTTHVQETERRSEAKVGVQTGDRPLSMAQSRSRWRGASCPRGNAPTALNVISAQNFNFYTQTVKVNKSHFRYPRVWNQSSSSKASWRCADKDRKRRGSGWMETSQAWGVKTKVQDKDFSASWATTTKRSRDRSVRERDIFTKEVKKKKKKSVRLNLWGNAIYPRVSDWALRQKQKQNKTKAG